MLRAGKTAKNRMGISSNERSPAWQDRRYDVLSRKEGTGQGYREKKGGWFRAALFRVLSWREEKNQSPM
jgi:hypothetical protein